MDSMFSYRRKYSRSGSGSQGARAASILAAAFGAFVWMLPAEGQAAPTCTTKPAVCARLAAQSKQRTPAPLVVAPSARPTVATQVTPATTCTTKPSVCARLDARGHRPSATPVTLASNAAAGPRCSSKPAVCARLRVRPTAAPMTLATTAGDAR